MDEAETIKTFRLKNAIMKPNSVCANKDKREQKNLTALFSANPELIT